MSFDIHARCKHCGTTLADWDPTYNYGDIFRALSIHPCDAYGTKSSDYAEKLGAALAELRRNPEKYRAMESKNGWGTVDQLIERLPEIIDMFSRAGDAEVCR